MRHTINRITRYPLPVQYFHIFKSIAFCLIGVTIAWVILVAPSWSDSAGFAPNPERSPITQFTSIATSHTDPSPGQANTETSSPQESNSSSVDPSFESSSGETSGLEDSKQIPIMVDGRVLFEIGSIEGFSARGRADAANGTIERFLRETPTAQPITIFSRQIGNLTTIRISNHQQTSEHLLTVTEGDFLPGILPMDQAHTWEDLLQSALEQAQRERTPEYRRRATYICAGLLAFVIALHFFVRWVRRYVNRCVNRQRALNHDHSSSWASHWSARTILQPLLFCLQIGVWLGAIVYFSGLFPITRYWRYRILTFLAGALNDPIFDVGETSYSTLDLLKILVLAIGLWIGVRAITAILRSRLLLSIGADPEIQDAIAISLQFLLTGVGLIIILQGLGFDVSSLAIIASVLGVGIGFGLQEIANNFISGLVILFERPIRVGDFISVGDLAGTVDRIGARSTEIRTLDYVTIIVPNSEFIQTKVINWSHGHPVSRLHVPFGVAYGSGIRLVRNAVFKAVGAHPEILRYPQPQILFQGFGDSSLDFDLLVWIREPRYKDLIRSDLYYLIEASFRRHHIEIPFPQRDLHMRSPEIDNLVAQWSQGKANMRSPMMASQQSEQESLDAEQFNSEHVDTPLAEETNTNIPIPQNLASQSVVKSHKSQPMLDADQESEAILSDLLECSLLIQHKSHLTDSEMTALVEEMRGINGVEIKDRRYRLRSFSACFVGSEAVAWLMQNQKATREEAIRLGQILVERGIIHHVTDEHTFEDEYLFYRFYEDEVNS